MAGEGGMEKAGLPGTDAHALVLGLLTLESLLLASSLSVSVSTILHFSKSNEQTLLGVGKMA